MDRGHPARDVNSGLPTAPMRGTEAARYAEILYLELKGLARAYLAQERRDHTLQATALVHEAYIRLSRLRRIDWQGRTHFLAMAARQMRRVLVEYSRARKAAKRGGGARPVSIDDRFAFTQNRAIDVLALDEALSQPLESEKAPRAEPG